MPFNLRPPCTVFVADGHVAFGDLLIALLNNDLALRVVGFAKDGRETCEQCSRLRPRLLILDLELPVLNGVEVIARLIDASPETKVLLFTDTARPALLQGAIAGSVRGIVRKVEPVATVLDAIHTIADGHAYFEGKMLQLLQTSPHPPPDRHGSLVDLTARELDVFRPVVEGRSNKEVALGLGISVKTTETHRKNLMQKLGARNTADLTREAFRLGVLTT
jgi:DNA-binding NarL/FixJ family response regulator